MQAGHCRRSRSRGCAAPSASRGFTLIELLVVMLLMVIVLAMVGLGIGGSESREVREEADRIAVLLQNARQESILQGKVFAVMFSADGYKFLVLDNSKRKFVPVTGDDILRPRRLPASISIRSVVVDGSPQGSQPRLILLPTGELPTFSIVVARGDDKWQVDGTPDGQIKTVTPNA